MTSAPSRTAPRFRDGAGLLGTEWAQVLETPTALAEEAARIIDGIARRRVLDASQLGLLVEQVIERPDLWQPLVVVDPARRRYRLLYEDDRIDLWVLSWMPGQGTGFHDHGISSVGLGAATGSVIEQQLLLAGGARRHELTTGTIRTGGAGYIHSVGHALGEPAVTIHAYSPPLGEVGQYRAVDDGVLEREPQPGRKELADHTIAAAVPRLADGAR
jgi:predicted metal-dependent enzyme (double-stranded beta helix superfamily)